MRQLALILLIAGTYAACTPSTSQPHSEPAPAVSNASTMNKKETALAFVAAATKQDTETVTALVHEDYVQHNPYIPTGRDAFMSLFPVLQEHGTTAEAVRVFEDGNYVAIHHLWKGAAPFGADEMVSFDILRFDENGKIAEHWDAMMPNGATTPDGRTSLDGQTEVTDLDATAANKATAAALFDVIVNGSQEEVGAAVTATFLPNYLQHSAGVADGIPAVFEAFAREQWDYHKNHKIIGEGNFVLSVSEGTAKGVPTVFYDLLRFENGKVAEHWDVIQAIPSENLANNNTMFGF